MNPTERSSLQGGVVKKYWPLIVAFSALLLGIAGVLTLSLVYGLTGGVYPQDYGIVMDAGSTKTKSILYMWRSDKNQGTGCVTQEDSCKVDEGIANTVNEEFGPVVDCIKKVEKHIDPKAISQTPLYFAATAGMRLLHKTNRTRADEILGWLENHLNETGLDVKNVEIISGADEGVYGWIAANFLKETLEIPQKMDPWSPTTFGALDLGGASTQISYAIPKNDKKLPDSTSLTLYGQTHNVFSFSNLCYGRVESERRHRCMLIKDIGESKHIDPCLPSGFELSVNGSYCLQEYCTNSTKFRAMDPKKIYTFTGTSSSEYCAGNISKLLDPKVCKEYGFLECFQNVLDIPSDQKYLAAANYFFTADFLNVTESSLEEFQSASKAYCKKTMEEINRDHAKNKFATQYCYNALYIQEVLLKGFGFSNDTWHNIKFVDKISGKDVTWSLGYMINATNLIPEKARTPKLFSSASLAVGLVLFLVVIAGALFLFLRSYQEHTRAAARADFS